MNDMRTNEREEVRGSGFHREGIRDGGFALRRLGWD
jgi:hypothetical protein